jgi:hypothetical protein
MTSLACALAIAVASSFGAAAAPRPLEMTIQDDALFLHGGFAQVDRTAARVAQLGADRVRLTASWSALAPQPAARRRPAFDAADPAQYPQDGWLRLDRAVKAASRHDLDVMLDVGFWSPRWAVRRSIRSQGRQRWSPSPVEYGRFAEAVARRYSGGFADPEDPAGPPLPAVRMWTTWNEPNHASFLLPQWRRVRGRWRPASPHVYRRLHQTGYAAIKRVSAGNRVLVGGLASAGAEQPGERSSLDPLRFLREMACVDERLAPRRTPECASFTPIRADGFAHHPYSLTSLPSASNPDPDTAQIADLDRLSGLLAELQRRGRIADPLDLYLTEYGYESDPPDPTRGVSPEEQARRLSEATFLAWQRSDTRMFAQFLLQDLGPDASSPDPARRWRDYQSGLLFEDGSPKPALQAFKLPFWVAPRAVAGQQVLVAFGQVRPGSGLQRVAIEVLGADGVWRTVGSTEARAAADHDCSGDATEFLTDSAGFYLRVLPYQGALTYRARWTRPDGESEHAVPVTADPAALVSGS